MSRSTSHSDTFSSRFHLAKPDCGAAASKRHFLQRMYGEAYTSYAFGKRCREAGVMPSMGSVGDCYDNAMAESFWATLEREVLSRQRFKTQAEAKMAVFEWIEGWYNPHRRHSSLGYRSPVNYERAHQRSG